MNLVVDGSPVSTDALEKVLSMNPHVEHVYYLPSSVSGEDYDKETGRHHKLNNGILWFQVQTS